MILRELSIYPTMLKALKQIANLDGGRIERAEEAPLIARAALAAIGEGWRIVEPSFEDELRADEEREIVAEIEAEEAASFGEEEDGWDDPESREAYLHALEKDD